MLSTATKAAVLASLSLASAVGYAGTESRCRDDLQGGGYTVFMSGWRSRWCRSRSMIRRRVESGPESETAL